MVSGVNIYSHFPVIIGGRKPIRGKHPRLARLHPELFFPRRLIVEQIISAIDRGESCILLGLPGVGKSTIAEEIKGRNNPHYYYGAYWRHPEYGILTPDEVEINKTIPSRKPVFFDDNYRCLMRAQFREFFIQQIRSGKQLVFIGPIGRLADYSELAQRSQIKITILPPAESSEFHKNIRPKIADHRLAGSPDFSSPQALAESIIRLCGGNYQLGTTILRLTSSNQEIAPYIEKLLRGQTLSASELRTLNYSRLFFYTQMIFNNLSKEEIATCKLFFKGSNYQFRGMSEEAFWKLPPRQQERISIFIRTGLMTIEDNKIVFRGKLLEIYMQASLRGIV